jgi:pimeloyl-ACP methyl ester carboxylesterase
MPFIMPQANAFAICPFISITWLTSPELHIKHLSINPFCEVGHMDKRLIHHTIDARGTNLHAVETGNGPLVVFCHGFPATWRCWMPAMQAVADAGYRAVAFDMRGYGESDAPSEPDAYTAFETVGDVIGIIDRFSASKAILVGHDFGANVAWNAAMMRPDRIASVFGVSVPFLQPGGSSFLDQLRAAGKNDFYMFDQMKPETDAKWADASSSISSNYYWTSAEAPVGARWDPFDPERNVLRPVTHWPKTIDVSYFEDVIPVFAKTGFHGALNYYRAIDRFWEIASRAFAGEKIHQPSFFLTGSADGLNAVRAPTESSLKETLPGLRGFCEMENVGHWPQLEASERFNAILVDFLKELPS